MRSTICAILLLVVFCFGAFTDADAIVSHTWNQGCLISVSAWATDSLGNTPNFDPHRTDDNSTLTGLYHNVGGNWVGDLHLKGFFTVQPEPTHPYPTYQYSWKIDYTNNTADTDFLNGVNLANGNFNTNSGARQNFSFTQTMVSYTDGNVNMLNWQGKTGLLRFSLTCNNDPSCGTVTALKTVVYTYSGIRSVNLVCATLVGANFEYLRDPDTCSSTSDFKAEINYVSSEWNSPFYNFSTTPLTCFGNPIFSFDTGTSYYERYSGFNSTGTFTVTGKVQDQYGFSVDSMVITAQ